MILDPYPLLLRVTRFKMFCVGQLGPGLVMEILTANLVPRSITETFLLVGPVEDVSARCYENPCCPFNSLRKGHINCPKNYCRNILT
jgi:hypothetical protein